MVLPSWEPPPDDKKGLLRGRVRRRRSAEGSLDAFYSSSERRESAESDFGDRWTSRRQPTATFAVRWIETTGEIYALRLLEPFAGKMRLGLYWLTGLFVPNLRSDPDPSVEVIGRCSDRTRIEELMTDWQEQMLQPNSLEWLRRRLASLATTDESS
jgi:hypothetical protein